jgi:hypothetical protein
MCAPAIGAIAGIAGSIVSGIGAAQQADAQAKQDEYNAKVARINARSTRQAGYSEQEEQGRKYKQEIASNTAALAKNGVDPSFGSAMKIFEELTLISDVGEKAKIYHKAEGEAVAYENKATAYEASAAAHRQAGKIAMASSFLGGLGGAVKGFGGGGGGGSLMINPTG